MVTDWAWNGNKVSFSSLFFVLFSFHACHVSCTIRLQLANSIDFKEGSNDFTIKIKNYYYPIYISMYGARGWVELKLLFLTFSISCWHKSEDNFFWNFMSTTFLFMDLLSWKKNICDIVEDYVTISIWPLDYWFLIKYL